jgi:hypothetical protein
MPRKLRKSKEARMSGCTRKEVCLCLPLLPKQLKLCVFSRSMLSLPTLILLAHRTLCVLAARLGDDDNLQQPVTAEHAVAGSESKLASDWLEYPTIGADGWPVKLSLIDLLLQPSQTQMMMAMLLRLSRCILPFFSPSVAYPFVRLLSCCPTSLRHDLFLVLLLGGVCRCRPRCRIHLVHQRFLLPPIWILNGFG